MKRRRKLPWLHVRELGPRRAAEWLRIRDTVRRGQLPLKPPAYVCIPLELTPDTVQ